MVRVSVDVKGLAGVRALLGSTVRALQPPQITDAVAAAAEVFRDGAARRAPRRSGRLAASIGVRVVGGYTAQARTDLVYAQITEFGGGRGARDAEVLAFNPGGGLVFRRRSYTPAQPYWIPTFEQDQGRAVEAFADAVDGHIGA